MKRKHSRVHILPTAIRETIPSELFQAEGGSKVALFVFAHPDDESFMSAGLIVRLRKEGWEVVVVCATRGEEGQIGDLPEGNRKRLGVIREREFRQAAVVLGVDRCVLFPYRDMSLPRVDQKKLTQEIFEIMREVRPSLVVTFDEYGLYGHPDHRAIHRVTTHAFRLYSRESGDVTLLYVTIPDSIARKMGGTFRGHDLHTIYIVDISSHWSKKYKALCCHRTQKKDLERYLGYNIQELFLYEFYRKTEK
ncbi:MAG TPA: PIG-L family deacetylase [Patescibacteria group bacterium]|nr:PIG-L family deacetylase [Patescibacteria group bacterium]